MKTPFKIATLALLTLLTGIMTSHAQTEGVFKLKHKSSFSNTTAHNPFWPIGWVKGEGSQETEEAPVPITADSFVVTSVSITATPQAIINGKIYAEGDAISALYGAQKMKIQLVAITEDGVILQYLGKKYNVPLRRPELLHKAPVPQDDAVPKQDNTLILH